MPGVQTLLSSLSARSSSIQAGGAGNAQVRQASKDFSSWIGTSGQDFTAEYEAAAAASFAAGAAVNLGSWIMDLQSAPDFRSVATVIRSLVKSHVDVGQDAPLESSEQTFSSRSLPELPAERSETRKLARPTSTVRREESEPESGGDTTPEVAPGSNVALADAPAALSVKIAPKDYDPSPLESPVERTIESHAQIEFQQASAAEIASEASPAPQPEVPRANNFAFQVNLEFASLKQPGRTDGSVKVSALTQAAVSRSLARATVDKEFAGKLQKAIEIEAPEPKATTTSVQRFSVLIRGADQLVRLLVHQAAGQVKVAVHADNRELSTQLRESVPELLKDFDRQGYQSQLILTPKAPVLNSGTSSWNAFKNAAEGGDHRYGQNSQEHDKAREQRKALWALAQQLQETNSY